MQTHSLPRPWQTLLARAIRLFDKFAVAHSAYVPPEEDIPIVSRQRRLVPHYSTKELAPAEVVQGHNFCLTYYLDNHGRVMEVDTLRALLVTGMVNLYGKIQDGLIPMALKKDGEPAVESIITEVEEAAKVFFVDITKLLHERGVLNATAPFYYVPSRRAS